MECGAGAGNQVLVCLTFFLGARVGNGIGLGLAVVILVDGVGISSLGLGVGKGSFGLA